MIIATTPLSLKLIGGGDSALGVTIHAHYRIVIHRPAAPFRDRFILRHRETEYVRAISDVQHPLIRNTLQYLRVRDGLDLTVISDLPGRECPPALTVALLHALHAFREDEVNAEELARETLIVLAENSEQPVAPFAAYASAYGGVRRVDMNGWNHYNAATVRVAPERLAALQDRLLAFLCDEPSPTTTDNRSAHDAQVLLEGDEDLDRFGQLMHDPNLREPRYEAALQAGALGGTFTNDAGPGFLVLYAPPDAHNAVRGALDGLTELPLRFCPEGSRTLLLDAS